MDEIVSLEACRDAEHQHQSGRNRGKQGPPAKAAAAVASAHRLFRLADDLPGEQDGLLDRCGCLAAAAWARLGHALRGRLVDALEDVAGAAVTGQLLVRQLQLAELLVDLGGGTWNRND